MIDPAYLATSLTTLLAETFGVSDSPDGYMLETGHSGLLGTVDAISANLASRALTTQEPTIAGHCGHILFLLKFFDTYEQGRTPATLFLENIIIFRKVRPLTQSFNCDKLEAIARLVVGADTIHAV